METLYARREHLSEIIYFLTYLAANLIVIATRCILQNINLEKLCNDLFIKKRVAEMFSKLTF